MTLRSVEETQALHGRAGGHTLLAMKVTLVALVVVALSAAGWRGVSQANDRNQSAEMASGPQPKLASLAVVGELPKESTESLVRAPVAVAVVRQAEKRHQAEEKKRAIEAATLPERGVWNGSAPMPGSEVHEIMTMPMLDDEQAPIVALTFDDGPSEFTAEIVSILEKEDVPATFFFLGQNARNRPDDARMVADAGFAVGSHTMDHKDLKTLSPAAAEAQLADSTEIIDDLLGKGTVQCARAPYGSFNGGTLAAARKHGLGLVGWDVDTLDWKIRDSGSIRAKATVPGQRQLILMHDGGGPREATVEALPDIIAHYKAQGALFIELCSANSYEGN